MSATILYFPTSRAAPAGWADDAHGVLDAVEDLLARGRTSDVVTFCELAVAFLEANAADIDDPAPLVRLARRLGDLQRRAAEPAAPRRHPSSPRAGRTATPGVGRARAGRASGPGRRPARPPPARSRRPPA